MADTSGSGGSIGFTFNEVKQVEAGMIELHSATEKVNTAAGSLKDTLAETGKAVSDIDASRLDSQLAAVIKNASVIAKQFGLTTAETKKLTGELKHVLAIEAALAKTRKENAKAMKAEEDHVGRIAKGFKRWKGDPSILGVTKQVTGLDLSLGGIIATLVDVYNQYRKVGGLSMIAAGPLGGAFKGGVKAVGQVRDAVGELRGTFGMTYEEAAEVVTQMTRMGVQGDKLAGKPFVPKSLDSAAAKINKINKGIVEQEALLREGGEKARLNWENRAWPAEGGAEAVSKRYGEIMSPKEGEIGKPLSKINSLVKERLEVEKQINSENDKARQAAMTSVGYARELTAIQKVYGISVGKSQSILNSLEMDYRTAEDSAHNMLGAVSLMTTELEKSGSKLSLDEVLNDWGELLEKTRAYKTDVLGIMGLYSTLMRKTEGGGDFAEKFGLGGMSKAVKMSIMNTTAAMPTQMDLGWQSKMGQGLPGAGGGSPVENAMAFRDLFDTAEGTAEALKRVLTKSKEMGASGNPAVTRLRTEKILMASGKYTPDASFDLAKRMASGQITNEKIKDLAKEQVNEAKRLKELQKGWPKARQSLVDYAGTASRATVSAQDLIRQWLTDKLFTVLDRIRAAIETLAHFHPFSADTPEEITADREKGGQEALSNLFGGAKITPEQANKMIASASAEIPGMQKDISGMIRGGGSSADAVKEALEMEQDRAIDLMREKYNKLTGAQRALVNLGISHGKLLDEAIRDLNIAGGQSKAKQVHINKSKKPTSPDTQKQYTPPIPIPPKP